MDTLSKNGQLEKVPVSRIFYNSEDYDEFATILLNANVEEKLLEAGSFKGYAYTILTPNIILTNFKINKKVVQFGSGAPGYITFTIWNPNKFFSWRNYEMKGEMIGVLWNKEHQSVTQGGFNGLPVSIEENFFIKHCHTRGYPELIEKLKSRDILFIPESSLIEIRQLIKFVTQNTSLKDKITFGLVEEKLVDLLFDSLVSTLPDKPSIDRTHSKFTKVIDYLHENLSELTSVAQICNHVDIPERTLRRLMQKKYNLTPKKYLNRLRLNEVRKGIKSNFEDNNILQLASEYNFWHMGQFSRDYKNLFGEMPSETLRRQLIKV